MNLSHGPHRHILAAAGLIMLLAVLSPAEAQSEWDLKEISSYQLTEARLAKYSQAINNLGSLAKTTLSDCGDDDDKSDDARSIDDAAAKFDAVPGVHSALQSAGISSREYMVFTFALFQNGVASWALKQPGGKLPAGVSMDNVNFYRKHEAALQALGKQAKSPVCDDNEDEGDHDSEGGDGNAEDA